MPRAELQARVDGSHGKSKFMEQIVKHARENAQIEDATEDTTEPTDES
jgi:hypothetical protein